MKKIILEILKYFLVYLSVIILGIITLSIVSKIPRKYIEGNIKESIEKIMPYYGIEEVVKSKTYTTLHRHSETMLLNIMYCVDSDKPLSSIIEAKYYGRGEFQSLNSILSATNGSIDQYIRYWHGSTIFLRPLLIFFNINQIYIINLIVLVGLLIIFIKVLCANKMKKLIIGLITAIIFTFSIIVPFSLTYTITYYIMIIASILSIKLENKNKKVLPMLFFITGMLTYFFDFLITEILTLGVPMLCVLVLKYKKNSSINEMLKFVISSSVLWLIGYGGMLIAKGIVASIVLKINGFEYINQYMWRRINWPMYKIGGIQLGLGAIEKNIMSLVGFCEINNYKIVLGILITILIICISTIICNMKKDKRKSIFLMFILLIGLLPYVRYLLISNHSRAHYFFTFRDQFISILAISIIIVYGINLKKVKNMTQNILKRNKCKKV